MPLKLLQAFCHVTCVYLADLEELYVTGNAPAAHDVSCRLVFWVFFCASLSVCSQSAGAAGEKSLHPPAAAAAAHHSQSTAKFGGAPPVYCFEDLLRIFTAKLLRVFVFFFPSHRSTDYSKACWRNLN